MSSNIAGTGTDSQPKKRYVVFSVRQVRGNLCKRIKKFKRFLTNLRIDRRSGLSSVRSGSSTPEEPLIPHTDKTKEDIEPQKPAEEEFAAQIPEEQEEFSPAKHLNLHPSQVRSGSGTTATGKRGSAESTPKDTTRIDAFPKGNFKNDVAHVPLINRWDNHPSMRRKTNQPASLHEYWDMQMRLRGMRHVPESNHSSSETDEDDLGKNKRFDDKQDLPAKKDPGKKVMPEDINSS
ncbi:hypothetical protein N7453_004450 [Penicillium expansum]|nr:hypothetical protein N7453_004450 [Penicillium expansum]